ncbi:MAG: hypothetical protein NT062_14485, partial [Proteobacteria bacterium]|nr:hypothetical protein [Pseudomonadota bacterium]
QVGVLVASRQAARCEVRASMGEYRGFTATDWTIRLRAGSAVADVAWNGGDPAAQVRGASIVEDLARAGIATIHLRAPKRPTPELATWLDGVVARDVAGARVLLDGEPIDLGAPAL